MWMSLAPARAASTMIEFTTSTTFASARIGADFSSAARRLETLLNGLFPPQPLNECTTAPPLRQRALCPASPRRATPPPDHAFYSPGPARDSGGDTAPHVPEPAQIASR